MASLSKNRDGWCVQFYTVDRKKRLLWIGKVAKKKATVVLRHVEDLIDASKTGAKPEPGTIKWLSLVSPRIRSKLTEYGLCEAGTSADDPRRLLGPWCKAYMRTLHGKADRTRDNYQQASRWLTKHFGDDMAIDTITVEDAARWSRWMGAKLAPATASQHRKRAKRIIQAAVDDRLLSDNPFAGLKGSKESNPANDHYVEVSVTTDVMDACSDQEWRTLVAVCRFAGARGPQELGLLRWRDVLWDKQHHTVHITEDG